MTTSSFARLLSLLVAASLLAACGGGGGVKLGGGISGTGKPTVTFGTITATSALTVAGTTFDTTGTVVTIGGVSAGTADLRVGMTATVSGLEDGGIVYAESVEADDALRGPLQAKPDASTLVVLGQNVTVDLTTIYGPGISPASPAGLTVGDLLEIYGYVSGSGEIVATRIEREDSLSELRVTGFAASVDTGAETFFIGTQRVDYSGADTHDLPGGVPQDGQYLEVRGVAMLGAMGDLVATEVRLDHLEDHGDNDKTEIEGFITQVVSATRFVVGGVTVDVDGATTYEGGTAADIAVGARVEVEGPLASGVLAARKVDFEHSD